MKISVFVLVAAAALAAGCGKSSSGSSGTPPKATNDSSKYDTGNPLTVAPDYVGAVVQAQKYAEKQIDVAYINEDIQMFNASEGRYPKDLQEMIPTYLGKMPVVPQGYKLDYDTNTHTVKVVKQ